MTISSFLKVFLRVRCENWSPMFAFFILSLRQIIICKRCPNRFLSVILTISGYLIVFCSVRWENRSLRDSVIAKLPIFCSSSALASEKHRFLVQFPHFARFTDRSGRNGITKFEGPEGYRRGSQLCQGSLFDPSSVDQMSTLRVLLTGVERKQSIFSWKNGLARGVDAISRMCCSSSALNSKKHRCLIQFSHVARFFTGRSGRNEISCVD